MIPQPQHYPYSGVIPNIVLDRITDGTRYATVIKLCADEYRIKTADVFKRSRVRRFVEPRHIAMYIMRYNLYMGIVEIGNVFNLDHTTVLHGCKTVANLMETEPHFRSKVERIESQL